MFGKTESGGGGGIGRCLSDIILKATAKYMFVCFFNFENYSLMNNEQYNQKY